MCTCYPNFSTCSIPSSAYEPRPATSSHQILPSTPHTVILLLLSHKPGHGTTASASISASATDAAASMRMPMLPVRLRPNKTMNITARKNKRAQAAGHGKKDPRGYESGSFYIHLRNGTGGFTPPIPPPKKRLFHFSFSGAPAPQLGCFSPAPNNISKTGQARSQNDPAHPQQQ